jgi:bacteriorhodopsin
MLEFSLFLAPTHCIGGLKQSQVKFRARYMLWRFGLPCLILYLREHLCRRELDKVRT